jgi:hypothetical protein
MMRSFWLGSTSTKSAVRSRSGSQGIVGEGVQVGAGEHLNVGQAHGGGGVPRPPNGVAGVMILSCPPGIADR